MSVMVTALRRAGPIERTPRHAGRQELPRKPAMKGDNHYMSESEDQLKRAAAESAVRVVTDGMIVGLGSGSTAAFAVRELGARVKQGLQILGIPTSEQTAAQARA